MTDRLQEQREITYRIGWRKGTIRAGEATEAHPAPEDRHEAFQSDVPISWVWRPVPFLPVPVVAALFCLVPAFLFGAVVWLVMQLKLLE
ncbi:MAG: hypothetical protein J7639_16020 [Paenibacillaceae bacterium]|nr:hypothetical protein [Paenibacillaceae bacterium]